ncbi:MAG TPA: GNAT family N-acetyltransferase, partial [Caulobacteraceae bacterium]|nr:GNAT family N-acetyltransferase [Caulobacteraceae bacterium]
ETRAAMARWIAAREAGGPMIAYALRAPGGALAGGCEVRLVEPRVANVSYWTYAGFRGGGLARRALSLLCRATFAAAPELERIEAHVDRDNWPSRRTAENAGFTEAGTVDDEGQAGGTITRVRYVLRPGASRVEVSPATAAERPALEAMMQLYVHDFSEQFPVARAGHERFDLGDDGRFQPYPLDAWWREADHIPLLIRADGRLAGFALVDARSHAGEAVDRDMAEFFIARKFRRGGVGRAAAHAIFRRWPGTWEAAVARRNRPALAFWRQAVATCPGAVPIAELDRDDDRWNGWILRFRTVA